MGSTHLDENSPRTEPPQETTEQFTLTYLLGPPTRGVDAIAFVEVAEEQGLTPEESWIQVVERNVKQLLECDAEGWALLDKMVSTVLGEYVQVWEAEATTWQWSGGELPGLVINPNKILDVAGRPTEANLADRLTLSRIADVLMDFTRADLAVCTINSEKTEITFPFPRRLKKRSHNA